MGCGTPSTYFIRAYGEVISLRLALAESPGRVSQTRGGRTRGAKANKIRTPPVEGSGVACWVAPRACGCRGAEAGGIARDNLDAALRFLDAAEGAFELLLRMPEIGTLCRFRSPQTAGLRVWSIKGFENHIACVCCAPTLTLHTLTSTGP